MSRRGNMCQCMYLCPCVHVRGKVRAVLHAGQVVYSSGSLAGLTHVSQMETNAGHRIRCN